MDAIEPDRDDVSTASTSSVDTNHDFCASSPKKQKFARKLFSGVTPGCIDEEMVQGFRSLLRETNVEEKNILLGELLCTFDLSNLEYAESLIGEMRRRYGAASNKDPFAKLPPLVILRVLHFVDPKTLCRCLRVCRSWKELCSIPYVWKELCIQDPTFRLGSVEAEQRQLQKHTLPDGTVNWKEAFSERYRLYSNWRAGRCVVRTFEGHTQGISCVQFDDERIVSGSSDGTIRLWDIRDNGTATVYGRLGTMTLTGHSDTVRCLHLNHSRLASGSNDCTIKIWDLAVNTTWSSIACRQTMVGHTNFVRCLQMEDDRLISGSYDHLLKFWSVATGQCTETLTGHTGGVLCLQSDSKKLVSGSADLSIKSVRFCMLRTSRYKEFSRYSPDWNWPFLASKPVTSMSHSFSVGFDIRAGSALQQTDALLGLTWRGHVVFMDGNILLKKCWDERTGNCVMTLHNAHEDAVTCLRFDNQRIVSGSVDKTIKMWDVRTGRCLSTLGVRLSEGHTGVVRCLQVDAWRLVSAADDRTIKVWTLNTGERLCTLRSHTDGVTCLQFNDQQIVSGSYDRTVKLWDFSVG